MADESGFNSDQKCLMNKFFQKSIWTVNNFLRDTQIQKQWIGYADQVLRWIATCWILIQADCRYAFNEIIKCTPAKQAKSKFFCSSIDSA